MPQTMILMPGSKGEVDLKKRYIVSIKGIIILVTINCILHVSLWLGKKLALLTHLLRDRAQKRFGANRIKAKPPKDPFSR